MDKTKQDSSPQKSVLQIPLSLGSRRGSVSSLASKTPIDKDVRAKVLDQIHSSASQTSTLTTFKDFAPPPLLADGSEEKGFAGHVAAAGVGGFYGRLKASVGGVKDVGDVASAPKNGESDSINSKLSTKSESNQAKSPKSLPSAATSKVAGLDLSSLGINHDAIQSPRNSVSRTPERDLSPPVHRSRPTPPHITFDERQPRFDNAEWHAPPLDHRNLAADSNRVMPQAPTSGGRPHGRAELDGMDRRTMPSRRTQGSSENDHGNLIQDSTRSKPLPAESSDTSHIRASIDGASESSQQQRFEDFGSQSETLLESVDGKSEIRIDRQSLELRTGGREQSHRAIDSEQLRHLPRVQTSRSIPIKSPGSTPESASSSRPNAKIAPGDLTGIAASPARSTIPPIRQSGDPRRKQLISKEFWMKDENAKVCFLCGDAFSTFRRKHHCRMCGQIYDAKCTSLMNGKIFGQPGAIRVCKTCQTIVNVDNDSSDDSQDDEFVSGSLGKQLRHASSGADLEHNSGTMTPSLRSSSAFGQDSDLAESPRPTTASTSRLKEPKRKGLTLFGPEAQLAIPRPSSSRSLKSLAGRPRTSSYKHHPTHLHQHSTHIHHMRSLRAGQDDSNAPFRRDTYSDQPHPSSLPAFHTDSIIDPDLEQYLSSEESSDEGPASIDANIHDDNQDQNVVGIGNLFSAMRKARSHAYSRSGGLPGALSRDADTISIASSRLGRIRRPLRSRTLSMSSIGQYGPSPRLKRSDNVFTNTGTWLPPWRHSNLADESPGFNDVFTDTENGIEYEPSRRTSGELNAASLQHVRHLLRQSLYDAKIDQVSRWEKVLMPIVVRCAENLDPSLQRNDNIDVRQYVKLKKVLGGRPSDSSYISGVVFTGNIALKRMPRRINNARLLLVSFPIMYARHQQHFMSLEPIILQEREYLRKLVNRILALQPDVLLIHQPISGLALEFLQEADVAVVCNVKESVMHAISRCARTRIVSSADKLTMNPNFLGYCGTFEAKPLMSKEYKKSYIFISGCQPDLGCTVLLRGADLKSLWALKSITEFLCFVAYNLKLETSLLRDEFVSLSLSDENSKPRHRQSSLLELAQMPGQISKAVFDPDPEKYSHAANGTDIANGHINGDVNLENTPNETEDDGVLVPLAKRDTRGSECKALHSYADLLEELKRRILSVSPSVNFEAPYLLQRGQDQESQLLRLRKLQARVDTNDDGSRKTEESAVFQLVQPEMVYDTVQSKSQQVRDVIRAIHDAEFERTMHRYNTLRRRWEIYLANTVDPFSPYSHQRIVVLFSVISTASLNACAGPDLLAMEFYQEHGASSRLEPDVPLGDYIESLCMQADSPCITDVCDQTMLHHHRRYVHGEGQISICLEHQPPKLKGLQDTILMWSRCKVCDQETQVVPMSSNTWKYSFGKYLELSFWSRPLHPRAGLCPHDIHRDHDRFFGFRDLVICVHYEPINLMEVIVPRATITWKVDKDLQLKNAQYTKIENRLVRFMSSVKDRLDCINLEGVALEKVEACKTEIISLSQKADEDLDWLKAKLREKYMTSKFYENVPLNRAIRAMQEKVAEWDSAFIDFERNFLPSDKDLRAMVTQQLKKMYLNREESASSITTMEPFGPSEKLEDYGVEKSFSPSLQETTDASSQFTRDSGHNSLTEPDRPTTAPGQTNTEMDPSSTSLTNELNVGVSPNNLVQQLDLAAPMSMILPSARISPTQDAILEGPQRIDVIQGLDRISGASEESKLQNNTPSPSSNPGDQSVSSPTSSQKLPQSPRGGHFVGLRATSPALIRSKTQPEGIIRHEVNKSIQSSLGLSMTPLISTDVQLDSQTKSSTTSHPLPTGSDKDVLHRIGASPLKKTKSGKQSMIPRVVQKEKPKDKTSRVQNLAMHFERISREFEKERLKERRQKFSRNRLRAFPTATSNPVVEVYRNAQEAVHERGPSEDSSLDPLMSETEVQASAHNPDRQSDETESFIAHGEDENAREAPDLPRRDENAADISYPTSEFEGAASDNEVAYATDGEEVQPTTPIGSQIDLELPKHEKSTLMKMLAGFWSERSASGWTPLEYPLVPTDHVFADSDVIVREDEPSSLIAFSLASHDYQHKMQKFRDRVKGPERRQADEQMRSMDTEDPEVENILLGTTATHLKYQFQDGQAIMNCKVFYSESFDAIRRKCGVADRFVESLSRCLKWDSKGGKTKSLFLKTLDERFVLKSLSQVEVQAFLKFAPDYFHYMSETLFHSLPSAIAKILGFYQVVIKNPVTGTNFTHFLQVMENVFYEGPSNRMFDLKGSMRNRRIESTGEENEVLLDENLLDYVSQAPVYVRNHANAILAQSIQNDTLFCSKQNVMDYSLVVGLYDDRKELVVGVIDYIRTYTWDKKLESMIKDRGKHKATVREPRKYRARFRESIARYFPLAPSCWHVLPSERVEAPQPHTKPAVKTEGEKADKGGDVQDAEEAD